MKRQLQISRLLTVIIVLAIGIGGCGQKEQPLEEVSYRLKWLFNISVVGDLWADAHGNFERNGLKVTLRMNWRLQVKIRAFENINKIATVIVGSGTLAMVGTIVSEFIAANAGIGHSIRIALYQSDLAKVLVALFLIGICTSLYLVCLEWLGIVVQKRLHST